MLSDLDYSLHFKSILEFRIWNLDFGIWNLEHCVIRWLGWSSPSNFEISVSSHICSWWSRLYSSCQRSANLISKVHPNGLSKVFAFRWAQRVAFFYCGKIWNGTQMQFSFAKIQTMSLAMGNLNSPWKCLLLSFCQSWEINISGQYPNGKTFLVANDNYFFAFKDYNLLLYQHIPE